MLTRAADALDTVERQEREVAALTLSLNGAQFLDFKQRLYELRQELLQAAGVTGNSAPDRVVQINFQMFPLSLVSEPSGSQGIKK
jgi:uncharacterized protein (TIGR02147 family)